MAFVVNSENHIKQLVGLTVSAEQTNEPKSVDLRITLGIHPDEIEIGDYSVTVAFFEAFLTLEVFGCEADQTTKIGMRRISGKTTTLATEKSVKASVSKAVANEAVGTGKLSLVDASLQLSEKNTENHTETTDVTLSIKGEKTKVYIPVEAIGNDRWRITDENGEHLSGYYLSEERLCRLVMSDKPSNRFGATLALKVKRRDINIQVTKDRTLFKLEKNKEKLLGILVASHLDKGRAGQKDEQAITFSEATVDDQG